MGQFARWRARGFELAPIVMMGGMMVSELAVDLSGIRRLPFTDVFKSKKWVMRRQADITQSLSGFGQNVAYNFALIQYFKCSQLRLYMIKLIVSNRACLDQDHKLFRLIKAARNLCAERRGEACRFNQGPFNLVAPVLQLWSAVIAQKVHNDFISPLIKSLDIARKFVRDHDQMTAGAKEGRERGCFNSSVRLLLIVPNFAGHNKYRAHNTNNAASNISKKTQPCFADWGR